MDSEPKPKHDQSAYEEHFEGVQSAFAFDPASGLYKPKSGDGEQEIHAKVDINATLSPSISPRTRGTTQDTIIAIANSLAALISLFTLIGLCLTVRFAFEQWTVMDKTYRETQKQTAAAIQSAQAAEDAANTSRDSLVDVQRAFISFHDIQNVRVLVPKGHRWDFQAMFENSGTTPAIHAISHFDAHLYAVSKGPNEDDFKGHQTRFGYATIGPKVPQSVGYITIDENQIWDRDLGDVRTGAIPNAGFYKPNYTLWGWVQYRDIFFPKTPVHVTEFCAQIVGTTVAKQPQSAENIVLLKFANCETHNCTDTDCPDYNDIRRIVPQK